MSATHFHVPAYFSVLSGLLPPPPLPALPAIGVSHYLGKTFDRDWNAMSADPSLNPWEKNSRERAYLSAKAELNNEMGTLWIGHSLIHLIFAVSALASRFFKASLVFAGFALFYAYSANKRTAAQRPLMERSTVLWEQRIQTQVSDESRRDTVEIANSSMKLRFGRAFTPRTLEQWQGTALRV